MRHLVGSVFFLRSPAQVLKSVVRWATIEVTRVPLVLPRRSNPRQQDGTMDVQLAGHTGPTREDVEMSAMGNHRSHFTLRPADLALSGYAIA